MHIIETVALITINETLIVQMVSFLIFLFIINRLMLRPLHEMINRREGHIENTKQEIVDAGEKLEDLIQRNKMEEDAARDAAYREKEMFEESGKKEAHQILTTTAEEISRLRKEAQKKIDGQIVEARKHIQAESESLAFSIMENVLERRLSQ